MQSSPQDSHLKVQHRDSLTANCSEFRPVSDLECLYLVTEPGISVLRGHLQHNNLGLATRRQQTETVRVSAKRHALWTAMCSSTAVRTEMAINLFQAAITFHSTSIWKKQMNVPRISRRKGLQCIWWIIYVDRRGYNTYGRTEKSSNIHCLMPLQCYMYIKTVSENW